MNFPKGWVCHKYESVTSPSFPTYFYCKPNKEEEITICEHSGIQFNKKGETVGFI